LRIEVLVIKPRYESFGLEAEPIIKQLTQIINGEPHNRKEDPKLLTIAGLFVETCRMMSFPGFSEIK